MYLCCYFYLTYLKHSFYAEKSTSALFTGINSVRMNVHEITSFHYEELNSYDSFFTFLFNCALSTFPLYPNIILTSMYGNVHLNICIIKRNSKNSILLNTKILNKFKTKIITKFEYTVYASSIITSVFLSFFIFAKLIKQAYFIIIYLIHHEFFYNTFICYDEDYALSQSNALIHLIVLLISTQFVDHVDKTTSVLWFSISLFWLDELMDFFFCIMSGMIASVIQVFLYRYQVLHMSHNCLTPKVFRNVLTFIYLIIVVPQSVLWSFIQVDQRKAKKQLENVRIYK
uniref:TLC domain-containing protein n=1 Tax=Heterorhabditis bacteriophora TaxID=37862 RepID=A0A1I7W642_HETBA